MSGPVDRQAVTVANSPTVTVEKSPTVTVVVGARPQFVKCALLGDELTRVGLRQRLVHTGQHYDEALSDIFFRQLGIPEPDINLGIGSGEPAAQTGRMMMALAGDFAAHPPVLVLVFGDTNSTLSAALAASKIGLPLAHVEAGLRSRNRAMPEEHNRIMTDHLADLHFCHNEQAAAQLRAEQALVRAAPGQIVICGDTMRETLARFRERASESPYPVCLGLASGEYAVLTVHRPVNADDGAALGEILRGAEMLGYPVVFPVHPRTRQRNAELFKTQYQHVRMIEPLGYLDMIALVSRSRLVLTDSGGLQKEALFLGVPCVTLRGETEWTETIAIGMNALAGDRPRAEVIVRLAREAEASRRCSTEEHAALEAAIERHFGPLAASRLIAEAIRDFLLKRE